MSWGFFCVSGLGVLGMRRGAPFLRRAVEGVEDFYLEYIDFGRAILDRLLSVVPRRSERENRCRGEEQDASNHDCRGGKKKKNNKTQSQVHNT